MKIENVTRSELEKIIEAHKDRTEQPEQSLDNLQAEARRLWTDAEQSPLRLSYDGLNFAEVMVGVFLEELKPSNGRVLEEKGSGTEKYLYLYYD